MHTNRTVLLLTLVLLLTNSSGQAQLHPPCPNVAVINDNPTAPGTYQTAHGIWSSGKVAPQTNVEFGALEFIELKNGFEVTRQATFLASLDGCDADCEEQLPICTGEPCPLPPFKLDSEGRKYEPGKIVISLPSELEIDMIPNFNYPEEIQLYLDTMTNTPNGMSMIKRCMCDENIFIYESFIPINEEDGVGQATNGYRPRGEGIIYGLNYLLEPDYADKQDDTQNNDFDFALFEPAISTMTSNVVAFLDSGVDPTLLPPGVLLHNGPTSCFSDDFVGWNFIDDTNNILDDRGHGTTVVLNYLNALNILGVNYQDQVILPVKVLDGCGRGTMYSVVCGLYYAKSKGAKIINNSWGMYHNDIQLQEAMIDMNDESIAVSCSAGNSAKDLDIVEHFPSGYSQMYFKLRRDYSGFDTLGLEHAFEVGGLCRPVQAMWPATTVPLWPETNHRNFMFAEAAIRVESLLNSTPGFPTIINCGISGTSYAAPQFTAGLLHFCLSKPGKILEQSEVFHSTQQISPTNDHYSYILDKL